MLYVVELTYYDTGLASEATLLFGTRGFTTRPTDTPANTLVDPRVITPAFLRRDLFDIATTGGASRVGYGELVLNNDDGALDTFNDYGLDGRTLTVRIADNESAVYPAGYTTLFSGTMEEIEVGLSEVRIRLRDRQVYTTRELQTNLYGGTNALPDGVDGIDSDLKGKPKPILYGACFNVEPPLVNTSRLIYQVNDGAVRDVTAVYDSGALLTHGADYVSQSDMEAVAPAAGEFRVWKAGGMFRLGTTAAGQVTADAVEGDWPVDRTAAQIFARLLTERAGRDISEISATDLTALDTAQAATLGLYIRDAVPVSTALDRVAQSVGAWWSTDASGLIRLKRLEAPSGTAVLALTQDNIISLTRVPLNDGGLPVYRYTVRCVPNYTVQTSGLVGQVNSARRARLAQPFQDAYAEDSAVRTAYLLAPERTVETLMACRGKGDTEASRLLTLYKVKRDRFEVVAALSDVATLAAVELGAVISVTYDRYGLSSGKLFRTLGYQLDPVNGTVSLTLWG
jgi:hypothetical protein